MKIALSEVSILQASRFLAQVILLGVLASTITACARSNGMVRPSDKIGGMRVNRYGHTDAELIWDYCSDGMPDEPGLQTTECKVPMVSELFIGLGVFGADKTQRDALWEARTWELTIDGYPVDLKAFNIADFDREREGRHYEYRVWRIRLRNLTGGKHTLHYVMHVNREVDGDPSSQSPGAYELVVNFVVKK
jgi:hypothetical protein